jgi:hypothetical protein
VTSISPDPWVTSVAPDPFVITNVIIVYSPVLFFITRLHSVCMGLYSLRDPPANGLEVQKMAERRQIVTSWRLHRWTKAFGAEVQKCSTSKTWISRR